LDAFAGTGSSPQPPQGLHRHIRHAASADPRTAPWTRKASTAYSEQLGVNRHRPSGPDNAANRGLAVH
jgi:hypothetical protein